MSGAEFSGKGADSVGVAASRWKNSTGKNYGIAAIGEFLGTFLFLFFGFSAVQCVKLAAFDPAKAEQNNAAAAVPTIPLLLYISFAFGFSLAVNVFLFYRVSGGLFNPAVTLAVTVLGKMPPVKAVILVVAQLIGGIFAAGLAEIMLPGDLAVDTTINYATGITTTQALFFEAFLTFELVFTILMLAVEKHRATFVAPLVIGLALFIAHLASIPFTGASLNPARSFGPAVVTANFDHYHWVYWVGPGLGALAAAGFYKLLILLDYTTANPGQDDDGIIYPHLSPIGVRHSSVGDAQSRDGISPVTGKDMV